MIIDSHGHVTAPEKLYVYKANILSHRGAHGRGSHGASDQDIKDALNSPVFGGSSHLDQLKEVGHRHAADLAASLPDDAQRGPQAGPLVHRRDQQHHRQADQALPQRVPRRLRVAAESRSQPQGSSAVSRKVRQGDGIRRMPAQSRSRARPRRTTTPPLGDRFWYPLYEKLVELDIPGHIHSAGCRSTASALLAALHQRGKHRRRVAARIRTCSKIFRR